MKTIKIENLARVRVRALLVVGADAGLTADFEGLVE